MGIDAEKIRKKCRKLIDKRAPDAMNESERSAATSIALTLYAQTDFQTPEGDAVIACVETAMEALRRLHFYETRAAKEAK